MKSFTHVYMANLIIGDLENNLLRMPSVEGPYRSGSPSDYEYFGPRLVFPWKGGAFTPPPSVRSAILNNKAYFRAGAIGPDMFPDFLFGQGLIHPDHSGAWLQYMFAEYGKRPANDPERPSIYAFLLGQMMHYSADLFGHGFVNDYALGWFPSVSDLLTDEKRDIVTRHMMVEAYMDKMVPRSEPIDIKVPYGFLFDCFTDLKGIRAVIATFDEPFRSDTMSMLKKMPLYYLLNLREEIYKISQDSAVNMLDVTNYFRSWDEDIERAIRDWFATWGDIAATTVHEFDFEDAKAKVLAWKDRHLESILGIPDWIVSIKKAISFITDFILAPFKLIMDRIEDILIEIVFRSIAPLYNMRELWRELKDALKNPEDHFHKSKYFPYPAAKENLDADFGNYGDSSDTMNQGFRAFSDSLSMGKMCLMGPENLNAYFGKGDIFRQTECDIHVKSLRVTIKTGGSYGAGTDDNIYFDIYTKSGRLFSVLFDKMWHNDFERGAEATYTMDLPCQVAYSDLWGYGIHKDFILFNDDWVVERIKVTDPRSGYVLADDLWDKKIRGKDYHRRTFKHAVAHQKSVITVDPRIITFLFSLDGQDRTRNNPAEVYPWEDGQFAVYWELVSGNLSDGDLPQIAFPNAIHLYGERIPAIHEYIINLTPNKEEDGKPLHHEMHIDACRYLPFEQNRFSIGVHLCTEEAIEMAALAFDGVVDCCFHCLREYHRM